MKITIENYRGIKSAAFDLDGVVMIAAKNAAGKSAVAQAAGAVLSGLPIPIPGVLKTMAGMLVRVGASGGFAQLDCDTGTARVDWPKASMKTKGDLPSVSNIAAGIEAIPRMEPKQRTERLIEILNAHPTRADLCNRLGREGINEQVADHVWQTVGKQGWDGAHAQAKETGARLKGQWEAVAGKRYGSRVAENFVPNEWDSELASESEESLAAKLTDARDTLDGMIAVSAVDDAERERLESLADELPSRRTAFEEAKAAFDAAATDFTMSRAALHGLRDPASQKDVPCPHCAGKLSIVGGGVIPAIPISEHDAEAWREAQGRIAKNYETCEALASTRNAAKAALDAVESAKAKLAALSSANSTQEQVEKARQAVRLADSRLQAFAAKTRADRLQSSILQNAIIVAALETSGVRQDALSDALGKFATDFLKPLSMASAWELVEIHPDMSLSYGGRAWALLSESERYRTSALLQVAIATKQESKALIIDAADILDREGRNGLISMLRGVGIPALVCITLPSMNDAPDLGAKGIGATYWVRDGLALPLATAKEEGN